MERTLLLIKPDFLHLEDEIMGRIAKVGGKSTAKKIMTMDKEFCARHYPKMVQKPFYYEIEDYMTSGPLIACIIEGEDIIEKLREIAGPFRDTIPGTLRGDYAVDVMRNVVHSSDSIETAESEIERFFN